MTLRSTLVVFSCCLGVAGLETSRRLQRPAVAQAPAAPQGEAMQTVVGKVVDLSRVLLSDGPQPAAAQDSPTAIPAGEPIGLLVDFDENPQPLEGTTTKGLFLLVRDRDNQQTAAAFEGLRAAGGQHVQITGRVLQRYGLTALEVQGVTGPPQGQPDE